VSMMLDACNDFIIIIYFSVIKTQNDKYIYNKMIIIIRYVCKKYVVKKRRDFLRVKCMIKN